MTNRNRSIGIIAFLTLLSVGAAQEQKPDKTGEHKYAGETCSWAGYDSERYIEMAYGDITGRIDTRDELDGQAPYVWSVFHPGGSRSRSSDSTARGALNGLCGAMIVAQELAETEVSYDPDATYRELVEALDEEQWSTPPAQPRP